MAYDAVCMMGMCIESEPWPYSRVLLYVILDSLRYAMFQEALLFSYEALGYFMNQIRMHGLPVGIMLYTMGTQQ